MVSSSMRMKLAAYILTLLLHMNAMTVDLTLLHRDLGLNEGRILELAKSMGLTLSKPARGKAALEATPGDEHRMASLLLPLVKVDPLIERRKRKKMR